MRSVLHRPPTMAAMAALVTLVATSCIIPDRDIQFEGGPSNPGAVRVLEQATVPETWRSWCLDPRGIDDAETFCPNVRATRPSGLIAAPDEGPDAGPFCVCPPGFSDARAPTQWTLYAEDPDFDGDLPADDLHGVLLLDPDPAANDPSANVAYENFLEPCAVGDEVDSTVAIRPSGEDVFSERVFPPPSRNTATQWAFRIDDAQGDVIDLCNDNNGASLEPGLHNLQFFVTDRPFFSASDPDGSDDFARLQCGVPDLPAGATYATINYIFECIDGRLEENAELCDCEDAS